MRIQIFRLKETEKQLKRIADALEYIVLQEYSYRMTAPERLSDEDESGVDYASDVDTLRAELMNVKAGKPVDAATEEE